ncbi:8-oxo-dGTP diphosphatase [Candidatus Micrarchaeota archaeon]|nr:8-oxo-dGTP diphosphatase [Candidatus Micrarchaeota archaeon]
MKIGTLGYLIDGNKILLAMKKRSFGKGWYNGVGGKIKPDESFEQALSRECEEEIDVKPLEMEHVADLAFYDSGKLGFLVKVYFINRWERNPNESEEMKPKWFDKKEIPYDEMWVDDKLWLPEVLKGKKIKGHFWFEGLFTDKKKMINHEIG